MKSKLHFLLGAALLLANSSIVNSQQYKQTSLVSNPAGGAPASDPALVNPWGLSRGSGTPWWVSDNGAGVATLYTGAGAKQGLTVTIPPSDPTKTRTGSPTGTIFNGSTTDFLLAPKTPALFIFATIDGTIAAWNPTVGVLGGPPVPPPSTNAVTVVRTTDGSSYTGLTSAFIDGKQFLYAANFTKGRIDVYDNAFHRVSLRHDDHDHGDDFDDFAFDEKHNRGGERAFEDDRLPNHYVPFNVQAIGNDIVVTYVLLEKGQQFETDGPGLGFVDIYSSTGRLLRRLEHGQWLNAPWGIALAPDDFGRFSHDLLIGQFAGASATKSSGFIAAYDLATGKLDGLLEDASGNPLSIPGVWAISPGNGGATSSDPAAAPAATLYFTQLANQGKGGLFGYLTPVATDLIKGNNQ